MNNDRQKTFKQHTDAQVCVFSSDERKDTFAGLSTHFSVEFVADIGTDVGIDIGTDIDTATSDTDACTQSIVKYLECHKNIELCIIDDAAFTDTDKQVDELICWLEAQSSSGGGCAGALDCNASAALETNDHLRTIFYAKDTRYATDALFARLVHAGIYDIVIPSLLPKGFTAQSTLMLYALKPQTQSSATRFLAVATTSETGDIDEPASTEDIAGAIDNTAADVADAIAAIPDATTNLAETAPEKQNAPAKEAILEPVRESSEEVMLKPSQVAQAQVPTVQQDIQTEAAQQHTLTQQDVPMYPQIQYHIPV